MESLNIKYADCLENIEVGKFVAVHLVNYDKVPVIGKVLEVSESRSSTGKDLLRGSGVHKMCPEGRLHGLMSSPKLVSSYVHFL